MKRSNPQPDSPQTILLVDDTPANLRLLSQILSEEGYQVRAVTSGEHALATAKLDPPDLILLDIRMPGLNGFEVCVSLKLDSRTRDVPVIFISALDEVTDKVKAFEVGGVDYITKPFQYEEVIARVETHLAMRRLQRQLERSNQRMARELALAGEVQNSFLPERMPEIDGWQFAVRLLPARQTSGDFFDTFALPDGRIAVLVADVVDKGVCAALFMSLTYALFRTFAQQHPNNPELVFEAMNQHILRDTNTNQFVTAFYGILDTQSGVMVYSNAGHPPPLIAGPGFGRMARWLVNTGVPLGVMSESAWQRREVLIGPQDVLFLYSDGVIEAESDPETPFGMERLLNSAKPCLGETAVRIRDGVIADVRQFTGDRPLLDDLVLFVIKRS